MGKRNSSKTRVTPVFNRLWEMDPSGASWLIPLLALGSYASQRLNFDPGQLTLPQPKCWGEKERRLDAPKDLLVWLVDNASRPSSESLWGGSQSRKKREKLVERDPSTIAEAHRLLDSRTQPGVWYVLEGRSAPDVYLEAQSAIIVVEGKRTERKATTLTTWMPKRSQMLRHMDAAWEIRGNKRVLGLMIVEGDGGADVVSVTEHWGNQAHNQVLHQTLIDSLPHRSSEEQKRIAAGFLGVTTWQRVCAQFSIEWPPCKDDSCRIDS